MNKAKIKAELRRSACEDMHPWIDCNHDSYRIATTFLSEKEWARAWNRDIAGIFFLLVAEAL